MCNMLKKPLKGRHLLWKPHEQHNVGKHFPCEYKFKHFQIAAEFKFNGAKYTKILSDGMVLMCVLSYTYWMVKQKFTAFEYKQVRRKIRKQNAKEW